METQTEKTLRPGDPEYGELIFSARKYSFGGKYRVNGRRYFAAANHAQNGELITQVFDDVWQKRSGMMEDAKNIWDLAESGEEKLRAFARDARVSNVTAIPEGRTHEEALAIAKEKFNMGPVAPAGRAA